VDSWFDRVVSNRSEGGASNHSGGLNFNYVPAATL
jgi:hypothetical protein